MEKTIEILIAPDGGVKVTAHGYVGSSCEEATRAYEEALGTITSNEHTEEFYLDELTKVDQ